MPAAPADAVSETDAADAADADVVATDYCLGTLVRVCFSAAPSGTFTATAPIDTDNAATCAVTTAGTAAGLCVIAAETITIPAGLTLTVRGSKPVVFVATSTALVSGLIDVSSHLGQPPGAGANPSSCLAGTAPKTSGGGQGGSHGGTGGNGGAGTAGAGGIATPLPGSQEVRGGCAGAGGGGGAPGAGGAGGGAVAIVAPSITVSGAVRASGAPGRGGLNSASGGGGGGAGGMIVLDAAMIQNPAGALGIAAQGGGGGEGSGSSNTGANGSEPVQVGVPAAGGSAASASGGDGGAGGVTGNGTGGQAGTNGGGGGGGGAGVVRRSVP